MRLRRHSAMRLTHRASLPRKNMSARLGRRRMISRMRFGFRSLMADSWTTRCRQVRYGPEGHGLFSNAEISEELRPGRLTRANAGRQSKTGRGRKAIFGIASKRPAMARPIRDRGQPQAPRVDWRIAQSFQREMSSPRPPCIKTENLRRNPARRRRFPELFLLCLLTSFSRCLCLHLLVPPGKPKNR
jgi:hypothetical protein